MPIFRKKSKIPESLTQLDLGLKRIPELDRNYDLGGRSFYFFDFDDNVVYLTTPIILFHKQDRSELSISSGLYAQIKEEVGKPGSDYYDYEFDYNDDTGSFRYFRDENLGIVERLAGKKQLFVKELDRVLKQADYLWKAPSWDFFQYATYNKRPLSIITARGHAPETIRKGIKRFVKHGHLPHSPNFLGVYPVTHPETRMELGDTGLIEDVASLKKKAIKESVYNAINLYGENPHHRFGMSDDDPANLALVTEAMEDLKREFPEMSFFVIDTTDGKLIKREVKLLKAKRKPGKPKIEQLPLI